MATLGIHINFVLLCALTQMSVLVSSFGFGVPVGGFGTLPPWEPFEPPTPMPAPQKITYMWDKYPELFSKFSPPTRGPPGTFTDKSWLIEAGKPGYELANAAWNKHNGFTFITRLLPPSTEPPKLVNRNTGAPSVGDEDDGDFAIILGASVGGAVFVLALLGIMLWRIIKMKKIRGQIGSSSHKFNHGPSFILSPGHPTGMPPVESAYHGAIQPSRRWKGHEEHFKHQNIMAVMPPVPGEVMYNQPPQINPWLK